MNTNYKKIFKMAKICPNTAPKSGRSFIDRCTDEIHTKIVHSFYQRLLLIIFITGRQRSAEAEFHKPKAVVSVNRACLLFNLTMRLSNCSNKRSFFFLVQFINFKSLCAFKQKYINLWLTAPKGITQVN